MRHTIHVQDFHGDRVLEDGDHLSRVLAQRYEDDANLFTLSATSFEYPWLNVYVRDGLAVLYYLPAEDEMLASVANVHCDEESVKFYDNEVNVNWLSASQVVSWVSALKGIQEFCDSLSLPTEIEWRRLA